jgi:hypothetical protein
MTRLRLPAALLALTFVAACRTQLAVDLVSEEARLPRPTFTIADPDHPDRPHYDTVRVYRLDGRLIWHLRAEPFGSQHSVGRLSYGEPVTNFDTVVEPEPLAAGEAYSLQVSGLARGSLRFRVRLDGRVVRARD